MNLIMFLGSQCRKYQFKLCGWEKVCLVHPQIRPQVCRSWRTCTQEKRFEAERSTIKRKDVWMTEPAPNLRLVLKHLGQTGGHEVLASPTVGEEVKTEQSVLWHRSRRVSCLGGASLRQDSVFGLWGSGSGLFPDSFLDNA